MSVITHTHCPNAYNPGGSTMNLLAVAFSVATVVLTIIAGWCKSICSHALLKAGQQAPAVNFLLSISAFVSFFPYCNQPQGLLLQII